jgi:type I restriction enzyme M protein
MLKDGRVMQRIPENKVVDIIDGKTLRNRNPEEYVRQNVARSLLQEYRYDRSDIAVELPIKVGSAKPRVDLAIFGEGKPRTQDNIWIIIECKKAGTSSEDKKEGIPQLKSYMAASPNCRYGLWTNGSDQRICLLRSEVAGEIVFDEIVDIPLKGQKLRDAEAPDRRQLRPATGDNLLFAFQRCHNYIAGNQGLQKPEAFWELLKVIFCKIEDERPKVH